MPLYKYSHAGNYSEKFCGSGYEFEIMGKMSEPALTHCPSCGGAVERVIQPVQRPIGGGTPVHH